MLSVSRDALIAMEYVQTQTIAGLARLRLSRRLWEICPANNAG